MKTAVKKSIRPMPRPTEKRMGELRKRAKETAETKRLERAITRGTEAKAIKQDLKAAQEDRKTVKKAGGGMVMGYAKGGCVMAGRGGKFKGEM